MQTTQKRQSKKQQKRSKGPIKLAVVFLEPEHDNSQSTVQNRDNEEPPLDYFWCNTIRRARYLVNEKWRGRLALALIYDKRKTDGNDLVAKWTMENEWNNPL